MKTLALFGLLFSPLVLAMECSYETSRPNQNCPSRKGSCADIVTTHRLELGHYSVTGQIPSLDCPQTLLITIGDEVIAKSFKKANLRQKQCLYSDGFAESEFPAVTCKY
jgi:hypothetical protein